MRHQTSWVVENDVFLAPEGTKTKSWRQLIIVRGLPSSGKSTHGQILHDAADFDWIEADHMFRSSDGRINVIPAQIKAAHEAARNKLMLAFSRRSNIVITNTATRLWEIASYLSVLGSVAPDCKWKVKIVDLQAGICNVRSLKMPAYKYLEMALRYEAIPPDFLARWTAHFNSSRGKKPTEDNTGIQNSGVDPIFVRRYLIDVLQMARIQQMMTEAQLNSFIAGVTSGQYTSYLDLNSDQVTVDLVVSKLRARPPAVFVPFAQVEEMLEERNVVPAIRHAVKAVWNHKN